MTEKQNVGVSYSGGASNSAPLTPLDFLKQYGGKTVKIKAKGEFTEDLLGKFGKTLKTEVFRGYFEGTYKVEIDSFGDVLLRYPYHVIGIISLKSVEINGIKVEVKQDE